MEDVITMTTEELESHEKGIRDEERTKLEAEFAKKHVPDYLVQKDYEEEATAENKLGHALRIIAAAEKNHVKPIDVLNSYSKQANAPVTRAVAKSFGYGYDRASGLYKAMTGVTESGGGYAITGEPATEIIPALRANTIMRKAGAVERNMVQGMLKLRTEGTGAVAYWIAPQGLITPSAPLGVKSQITSNKLAALVAIDNDLLDLADASFDAEVQNDLVAAMTDKEDVTFIRGAGGEYEPAGIKAQIDSSHVFAQTLASSAVTSATMSQDISKCLYLLMAANMKFIKPGWIMSPRTWLGLTEAHDANGNYPFKDEVNSMKLKGYPIYITTNIPDNLSGTQSEIYFVDFGEIIIGNDKNMELKVFPDGTYHDGSGLISGISQDETAIRVIMRSTMKMRRTKAAAMITGVTWGV